MSDPAKLTEPGCSWLLMWESDYGDEGEGRKYIGVFDNESDAWLAARTWARPRGFSSRGSYEVERLVRNPEPPDA